MKKKISDAPKTRLRHQAEAELSKQKKTAPATDADTQRLIYELEVHQIELEMQNMQLIQSRAEAEESHCKYSNLFDFAPVGYFTLARDSAIRQVNLAGAKLLGLERGKLIKRRFGIFVPVESRATFNAFLEKAFTSGSKETCEVALLKDEPAWARIEAVLDEGERETCRVVVSDISARVRAEEALQRTLGELEQRVAERTEALRGEISERKRTEDALRRNQAMLARTESIAQIGSWEWDVATDTVTWSDEMFRFFQRNPADGTPSFANHPELYYPEDMRRLREAVEAAISNGTPYEIELRAIRKDGATRVCLARGHSEMTPEKHTTRLFGSLQDITERKQAEEALQKSEATLKKVQEIGHMGSWEIDLAKKIVTASAESHRIYGIPEDSVTLAYVQSAPMPEFRPALDAALTALITKGERYDVEYKIQNLSDGEICTVHSIAKYDASRQMVIGSMQDITERKQAEEKLQKSEANLRAIFANSAQSFMLIDLDRKIQSFNQIANERAVKTFGKEIRQGDSIYEMVIPRDREDFDRDFQCALNGELVQAEKSFKVGAHEFHYEFHYAPVRMHREQVSGVFLSITDATERKRVEEELRKLSRAIEQSQVSVVITDTAGVIEYVNPKFVEVTGYKVEEVLGKNPRILQYIGKSSEEYQILWETILAGREWRGIFHNRKKNDEPFWESTIISPILNEHGKITHFVAVKEDITERKRAEDALKSANEQLNLRILEVENLQSELREQALHEPLTGLYNRRYLNETLSREITRAERENDPLSVIMADIDHFKMINDTYGHSVGDQFLVEIANLMKNHARSSDIVCRYGGEEFLLVLPSTTLDAAEKRAEELRQKCAEIVIQHEGKDLKVTMSFGVATYPDHGKESEEIITKADKALYRAKAQGRNCTVRFE